MSTSYRSSLYLSFLLPVPCLHRFRPAAAMEEVSAAAAPDQQDDPQRPIQTCYCKYPLLRPRLFLSHRSRQDTWVPGIIGSPPADFSLPSQRDRPIVYSSSSSSSPIPLRLRCKHLLVLLWREASADASLVPAAAAAGDAPAWRDNPWTPNRSDFPINHCLFFLLLLHVRPAHATAAAPPADGGQWTARYIRENFPARPQMPSRRDRPI